MPTTTSTSPRTRLRVSKRVGAALLMIMSIGSAEASAAPPVIACSVRAPASVKIGEPVPLTVALHNRGATKLAVLNWGTPFEEAWLQPFVTVTRGGKPLVYGGALVKRGDPEFDEYLGLAPTERREATIDMAQVFDFSAPGRYTVVPRIVLHDVVALPVSLPRARAKHQSHALACKSLTVIVAR